MAVQLSKAILKMSINGAEKDSPFSLNHLIISGDEKAALELILKQTDLDTIESDGFAPIHWAAKKGSKKIFRALVKKGANLYQQDRNGFIAYYYIKQHHGQRYVQLLEYYDEHYPAELTPTQDPLNQLLNTALQNSGLHSYSILPQENATLQNYLRNLFAPAPLTASKKRSQTAKPDLKKALTTLVIPEQLTEIAFGIIEELSPLEILTIINESYPQMNATARIACIYFVKELVRQDTASEWANNSGFIKLYNEFLQNLGSSLAMAGIRTHMKKLLGRTAAATAFDLTKAFSEAILRLTPQNFKASSVLKDVDNNEAFQAVSTLSNRLSEHVCMDILLSKTSEEGAARYRFYMDVIQVCLSESTNNFAAAFAIYNGLQFNTVQRLKSITSLIPTEYAIAMSRCEELFHPSYKGLRPLFLERPNCVPVVAFYCKNKDTISQYEDATTRVQMYGKSNAQFAKHCEYLRSLPHLTNRYQTDICDQIEKTTYDDVQAYWYSYQLEPAKVITLENTLSAQELEKTLKFCKDVHSPIVITVGNKKHSGLAAKQLIAGFARQQQWLEGTTTSLIALCDEATRLCDADMPKTIRSHGKEERKFAFKRSKPAAKANIDDLLSDAMNELKIDSPRASDADPRPRARTVGSHHDRRKSEIPNKRSHKEIASSSTSSSFTPLADLKRSPKLLSKPGTPEATATAETILTVPTTAIVQTAVPEEGSKGMVFK
jgi:hypothetical protein